MKLMHIADLHIGKRIHERSLLKDQQHILRQIIDIAEKEKPDGILMAGDIYDKSIPLEKGLLLLDDFLTSLKEQQIPAFLISGNHDSGERLQFGARILKEKGIYLTGIYQGRLAKFTLADEHGFVHIYLLPFIKPYHVRPYFEGVETYQEAVQAVIEQEQIDIRERNVLVAHQFVTNAGVKPMTCDSETIAIGGLDSIDASVFKKFDYVALGHLHGAQRIGSDFIRYSGSPLKYSFSEVNHKKSVTMVTLGEKGERSFLQIPITPLREMREIKGPLAELLKPEHYNKGNTEDYMKVTLTDEETLFAPLNSVRAVYPNVLRLDFENSRTRTDSDVTLQVEQLKDKSPLDLIGEFYEKQNNQPLNREQWKLLETMIGGQKV